MLQWQNLNDLASPKPPSQHKTWIVNGMSTVNHGSSVLSDVSTISELKLYCHHWHWVPTPHERVLCFLLIPWQHLSSTWCVNYRWQWNCIISPAYWLWCDSLPVRYSLFGEPGVQLEDAWWTMKCGRCCFYFPMNASVLNQPPFGMIFKLKSIEMLPDNW